jgi:hypothetical protein
VLCSTVKATHITTNGNAKAMLMVPLQHIFEAHPLGGNRARSDEAAAHSTKCVLCSTAELAAKRVLLGHNVHHFMALPARKRY